MNKFLIAAALAFAPAATAFAAEPAPAPAPAAPAMNTADTSIGDLLDNPAAKAVLMKHMPALAENPQIEMARGMTLKAIQPMAGDAITDEVLAKVDADLKAIK